MDGDVCFGFCRVESGGSSFLFINHFRDLKPGIQKGAYLDWCSVAF
jgi:hypothetical protein